MQERLRDIPQAERILADPQVAAYFPALSRPLAAKAVAAALESERKRAIADPAYAADATVCLASALKALEALDRRRHKRVLNGTGVVLNTSLGRSPIPSSVWMDAAEANSGYSPVEYDLETGARGRRGGLCHELAAELAGAEAAIVVNNNAAGVLLALSVVAGGRSAVIARGEQVQIGGGFRVPDILNLAGARFVEVGTTNVVVEDDYARAVDADTACVLLVHSSNFAIRGFTSKPSPARIVQALPSDIPVIADQGSGCTIERIPGETPARDYIEAGCALVCFSADKLVGGPQAGIVAGRADLIARLARHPLYRAFRPGKTVYSLLERVLAARLNGEPGAAGAALAANVDEAKKLARKIKSKLPKGSARVVDTEAASGGGSGPDEGFPSVGLAVESPSSPGALKAALRRAPVPLVATIRDGTVVVDMAALRAEDAEAIARTILWGLERSESLKAKAERLASRSPSPAADGEAAPDRGR